MGYQALLFCPDEKTARTVTQVLGELEFTVEACSEPFAAVKKLMGEHFDAVVVDCDNEQNATLLFKSARNSTSNQTSLAVAVVEGQAGVAKAFRIGANLVLTKPINIEQSKGTLRVARGLLRKGEPVKAASAVSPAQSVALSPATAASKSTAETRAAVVSPTSPEPSALPAAKPTAAWPVAASASTVPAGQDDDLLDIDGDDSRHAVPAATPQPIASIPAPIVSPVPQNVTAGGAASAPAPAREPLVVQKAPEPVV